MTPQYPKKTHWENFCHKLKNFDWGQSFMVALLVVLFGAMFGAVTLAIYAEIKQASAREEMMAKLHCQQTEKQRFVNTTEVGSAVGVNPATGGVVVGTTLSPGVKVENMWSCDGGVTIWK